MYCLLYIKLPNIIFSLLYHHYILSQYLFIVLIIISTCKFIRLFIYKSTLYPFIYSKEICRLYYHIITKILVLRSYHSTIIEKLSFVPFSFPTKKGKNYHFDIKVDGFFKIIYL